MTTPLVVASLALVMMWRGADPRVGPSAELPDERPHIYKWERRRQRRFLARWAPEPHMFGLGVTGGMLQIADRHELFTPDPEVVRQGQRPLRSPAPSFGVRLGYYPLQLMGLEAEAAVLPTGVRDTDLPALLYTVRGQVVGRFAVWSVTPFVVVGAGVLGIASRPAAQGRDVDPELHFGGGVELFTSRFVAVRLDIRDLVSHRQGVDARFNSHNLELSLGVAVTLGRENPYPNPRTR